MIFEPITIIKGNNTEFAVPLKISTDPGANVIAVLGDDQVSGVANADGMATLILPKGGTWSVNANLGGDWLTPKEIDVLTEYSLKFNFSSRLPQGYTELEYIETNLASYVSLGISIDVNIRVVLDVAPLSYSTDYLSVYLLTASQIESSKTYGMGIYAKKGTGLICHYNAGGSVVQNKVSADDSLHRFLLDWDMYHNIITLDGIPMNSTPKKPSSFAYRPYLFFPTISSNLNGNAGKSRLYSLTIYKADGIVGDFVPCKNPDNAVGLYDVVRSTFYKSAASGAQFIAGPEV